MNESPAEALAMRFHATYEALAPQYGYKTREASAKPWAEVPETNRRLMVAVCQTLLDRGVVTFTPAPGRSEVAALEAERDRVLRQDPFVAKILDAEG